MTLKDNVIITESKKRFLIIETVEYENRKFAFLVNDKNNLDTMFIEILDDGKSIKTIVPEFFEGIIYPLFNEKFLDRNNTN